MVDLKWHCFEDKRLLCCVQAPVGKEAAAKICRNIIGLEYDHTRHIYSCWNDASFLCQKYNLTYDNWQKAEKFQTECGHPYAWFEENNITVYFAPAMAQQSETYGAICSGCSEMFPYAVVVENFKCWKCRHGL